MRRRRRPREEQWPPGSISKHVYWEETKLRSRRITFARNRLDLTDRVQVRVVKKRLKVSDEQFANLVQKAGNSIAGLRKEATCQRLLTLPKSQIPPAQVPPAEAIASVEELGS